MSVSDIARAEKLERTYVGDVLPLTLLAPVILEAIVNGRQGEGVTLPVLLKTNPTGWCAQLSYLSSLDSADHPSRGNLEVVHA